ncbi:hypothetical protein KIN20_022078 [Parelaphostrongylus tenuis]|uniref:Transposase n=1 Tax=Parelaphostrongylus tenuis TaxID=148309 RepID=A0AAD5N7N8_PARTN|nr:hypothetical protein KIN20_022078 [Parelaphostrongylus tenuis]
MRTTRYHVYCVPGGKDPPARCKPTKTQDSRWKDCTLGILLLAEHAALGTASDNKLTINADVYEKQLRKLAAAVREKRPERLSVSLLQDNT